MSNEKDNIENLYAERFGNFESQTSEADWNALYAKLKVANFMKFSLATFNIYFLITLVTLAGTTAYLGINNRILSGKVKHLENTIQRFSEEDNESSVSNFVVDSINTSSDEITFEKVNNSEIFFWQNSLEDIYNKPSAEIEDIITKSSVDAKLAKLKNRKLVNTSVLSDSSGREERSNLTNIHSLDKKEEKSVNNESTSVDTIVKNIDTLKNITAQKRIKRVKKTVLIKQDKVIIKDTVVIKKKLQRR